MLHDDYLCLVESGKQQIKKVRKKFNRKTWKQSQLLSESGFILRIAPLPLSCDKKVKMKKSIINQPCCYWMLDVVSFAQEQHEESIPTTSIFHRCLHSKE